MASTPSSNSNANHATANPSNEELATMRPPFQRQKSLFGVPRSHVDPNTPNPYGSQNNLHLYHYKFFDPEIAQLRKTYILTVAAGTVGVILLVWACLPLYWGSFWLEVSHTPSLKCWIVNRDTNGVIGQYITQALLNSTLGIGDPAPNYNLGWSVVDPTTIGDDTALSNEIVNNAAWAAVVISEGASARLLEARANGDRTYDPTQAIMWYYSEARNQNVADSVIFPLVMYVLGTSTAQLNAQLTGAYMGEIAGNATAVQALARAPQTISQPVGFTEVNLRPFTAPTAIAVELVGCIYLVIIAFIWSMAHAQARLILSPHLRTRSYLLMRFLMPLLFYLPLSLGYAMISLPFKLPFDGKYSYAGGFFLFWAFCYISVCALGLAIEAMVTLMTPKYAGIFMVPWIISNVSVAQTPFELSAWFYRYGYGFPVYNLGEAARTILFNTRNQMGLNAGVILAWVVLSMCTMPVFTLVMRRVEMRNAREDVARGEKEVDVGYEGGGTMVED